MQESNESSIKWYQKYWVIILLLFFFTPAGIFLFWKYTRYERGIKVFVSLVFGFLFAWNLFARIPNNTPPQITNTQQQNNLPSKISTLPSIGATREEFEKNYQENARNSDSIIRYSNDTFIVAFDGVRAVSVTIQPLAENNHLVAVDLNNFLPTDTKFITDKTKADSMVKYGELDCHSDLLKSVLPKSNGNFGVYFNYDVKTGAFLGGTIRLLIE